ncbi:MAG: MarR family transcriptional regulator [Rhodospirillaceae bacterium]|nr:MarR family transcriptional regulator [Rhodospirillaceae bacterium]
MSQNYSIRSLERGLTILHTLSRVGPLTISEAALTAGLPRQTVSRILFVLEDLGYVVRRQADKRFEVGEKSLSLTDGLRHSSWLRLYAVPVMEALCRDILWPVTIANPNRLNMEVMWDTDALSPLVMRPAPIGLKFPLVTSISGRVYLANCSVEQRQTLIQAVLSDDPDVLDDVDLSARLMDKQLNDIKARGFYCDQMPHKGHSSLAAPIFKDEKVFAVLDIRFPVKALSVKEASAKFSDTVMHSAAEISANIVDF